MKVWPNKFLFHSLLVLLSAGPAWGQRPPQIKEFFSDLLHPKVYTVRIKGFDSSLLRPQALAKYRSSEGALLEILPPRALALNQNPCEASGAASPLYRSNSFWLRMSGNKTFGTAKASYKIKLPKSSPFFKMRKINLKSMWNDPSQMREALAWAIFPRMAVMAPRHTYAAFCLNQRYMGLYSVIENVDRSFLQQRFSPDQVQKANLYKGQWENDDLGPASLEYRRDGIYFRHPDPKKRSYRPKLQGRSGYADLKLLIETLHGQAGHRLSSLDEIFDLKGFLRWAAVNNVIGAWDNYWATPSNYYLLNIGGPFFHWIPWDYDNSFGLSYCSTRWEFVDLLDWSSSTASYNHRRKHSSIPMVTKVLERKRHRRYYLQQVKRVLKVIREIESQKLLQRTWKVLRNFVYAEAFGPKIPAHTGRQFTNHQIYQHNQLNRQLKGPRPIPSIRTFLKARADFLHQALSAASDHSPAESPPE